jgi:hypothetical protein
MCGTYLPTHFSCNDPPKQLNHDFAGDGIYEPFEPEMDYSTFGVRMTEDKIPILHEVFASIGEEEYARKQVCNSPSLYEAPTFPFQH